MKKNNKLLSLFMVLIVCLFIFTACNNAESLSEKTSEATPSQDVKQADPKSREEQKSNNFEITLSIINENKEAIYSEKVNTEKTNLLEIISNIDVLKMKVEDSEGGKFISSIMDISYEYGKYWECYINGEKLLENISVYEINDKDMVEFRYEKV